MRGGRGGGRAAGNNHGNGNIGHGREHQHHNGDGVVMRKGPWMAEEDEILLEYVRKHGPRDWSSIRSKGRLPRTGKSCRLRWVNKLKPDLKTGCKFSPEEERIVIDLQARFGNKWARIATYLPGRTDNDVKNFWSTRQKRLARLLQTPLPSNPVKPPAKLTAPPTFEAACMDLIPFGEESCGGQCGRPSYIEPPPDLHNQCLVNKPHYPTAQPLLLDQPLDWEPPPPLHLEHLMSPALDFPLLLDNPELIPGLGDACFQDHSSLAQLPESLPFFGLGVGRGTVKTEGHSGTPDSCFDDFPTDMFDYLDQPPPTSSSAAW